MKKILFAVALFGTVATFAASSEPNRSVKQTLCIACHGQKGISPNPEWPNLAGQHASYLLKQLQDIKLGKTRNAPTMLAIVASLSNEDMIELADFYAKLPVAQDKTPLNYLQRGEQLYRGGDFAKHITACIACHGPKGTGNGQAGFPVLSGQHALYTIQQLRAFKDKTRSNDLNSIMRDISGHMDEDDMKAVAYYLQGLY